MRKSRKIGTLVATAALSLSAFVAMDVHSASATPWTCTDGENYASCAASSGDVVSGRADALHGVFSIADSVDAISICRVNGACYLPRYGQWGVTIHDVPPGKYHVIVSTSDEYGSIAESITSPVVVVKG